MQREALKKNEANEKSDPPENKTLLWRRRYCILDRSPFLGVVATRIFRSPFQARDFSSELAL